MVKANSMSYASAAICYILRISCQNCYYTIREEFKSAYYSRTGGASETAKKKDFFLTWRKSFFLAGKGIIPHAFICKKRRLLRVKEKQLLFMEGQLWQPLLSLGSRCPSRAYLLMQALWKVNEFLCWIEIDDEYKIENLSLSRSSCFKANE